MRMTSLQLSSALGPDPSKTFASKFDCASVSLASSRLPAGVSRSIFILASTLVRLLSISSILMSCRNGMLSACLLI
jgi:hypothetical protein